MQGCKCKFASKAIAKFKTAQIKREKIKPKNTPTHYTRTVFYRDCSMSHSSF